MSLSNTNLYGWRNSASTQQWLAAEPYRFEFFQAVRILEQIALATEAALTSPTSAKRHVPLGTGPDPSREAARLRSSAGFDFPPSEVRSLWPPPDGAGQAEMTVNLFSLAGASAPLPDWVAELLQERARDHDHGLRDFLDIFHHRLLSLLYRVHTQHRPWLEPFNLSAPAPGLRTRNRMSQYLLSFAGLGVGELQGRLGLPDEELLPYAGLLWQRPRSLVGLESVLEHALGIKVKGRQMLGVWRRIEPEDRTRLGSRLRASNHISPSSRSQGRNRSLGGTATLGARIWDAQGRFDLILGPLTLNQFLGLLPGRENYRRIQALVQFYSGDLMDVKIRLVLQASHTLKTRLGRSRLGWTSWIGTKAPPGNQTVILPLL